MPLSKSNIISDIMGGASEVEQYNRQGVISYVKSDRVFQVDGANQFSTPRTAMSNAKNLIRQIYPVGSPCPPPGNTAATARQYAASPTGSDDVIQVTLSYMYTDISPSSTQWTIECTDFLETVDTDSELAVIDDKNQTVIGADGNVKIAGTPGAGAGAIIIQAGRQPIQVKYWPDWNWPNETPPAGDFNGHLNPATGNPADGDHQFNSWYSNLPSVSFGHVGVFRPRKRVIFTRTIYGNTQANLIESAADQYEGYINSVTFRNRKPCTWMCLSVGVIYNPFEGSNLARLEFAYRPPLEGWQPWVRYSSPLFHGTPPNVFRFTPKGSMGNGIRRSYQYLGADFNALLNLLPGGIQGDPSNQPTNTPATNPLGDPNPFPAGGTSPFGL